MLEYQSPSALRARPWPWKARGNPDGDPSEAGGGVRQKEGGEGEDEPLAVDVGQHVNDRRWDAEFRQRRS